MKMPKFKPTKWKLQCCTTCNSTYSKIGYYCREGKHTVQEKENIPFFVPDMEFVWVGQKWSSVQSKVMNKTYTISASRLEKIIKGPGIQPGGKIPNKWWMYSKVGSSLSLTILDE